MSCVRLLAALNQRSDNKCFPIMCRAIVFAIIVWHGLEKTPSLIGRAEAILVPKARICFNSMSSSFQSECVYCDSRLYASTMTACTGQPMLANNVTQAQAFCIATACLQVPVLQTGDSSLKVAADQLYEQSLLLSSSKLNHLLKPSFMIGKATKERDNWDEQKKNFEQLFPEHRRPTRSLSMDRKEPLNLSKMFTLNQIAGLPERFELASGSRMMQSSSIEATSSEPTTTTTPKVESGATSSIALPTPSVPDTVPKPNIMATEETRPSSSSMPQSIDYTNFNQAYAKIYSNLHNPYRPPSVTRPFMFWRPNEHNHPVSFTDHIRTQQSSKLRWAALQVAQMMQSISNGWAMKRSSLKNKWHSVSSRYGPMSLRPYQTSSYLNRLRHSIFRQPVTEPVMLQSYDLPSSQPIVSGSDTELIDSFRS